MRTFFIAIVISFSFPSQKVLAETFKVAVPVLDQINPITNQMNFANYIGMHLYYPLFEISPDGSLKSHFLNLDNSKALDNKFTRYDLCLKENVRFNDGSKIEVADFSTSFTLMAKMYPHLLPLRSVSNKNDRCLLIEMNYPTPNLFKRLTGIASTIIKRTEVDSNFPTGLGPYKLSSRSENIATLQYAGDQRIRFDQISFVQVGNGTNIKLDEFHDTNQLPKRTSEPDSSKDGTIYDVSIPKMYSIVINLKNRETRICADSILSKVDWVKAYQLSALRGKTFLPWIKPSSSLNNSLTSKNCPRRPIDLYVPEIYDSTSVLSAITAAGLKNRIRIKNVSNVEFGRKIFSGEEYIGLIGFDSTSSIAMLEGDYSTYFESFISTKNRIVSKKDVKTQQLITKATKIETTPREREQLYEQAEAHLISERFVLPVGSLKKQYRFCKGISVTKWLDYVNGVPEISSVQ